MINMNGDNDQQEVKYPHNRIIVTPQGIVIVTAFSPYHTTTVVLDEATCNDMVKKWVATRDEIRRTLQLQQHVKSNIRGSRND
jgi:hypothetical protein